MFNEIIYRNNNLNIENKEIIIRNGVRAIILNKNKILLVYVKKYNEYEFPGGGIEKNETNEEALILEIREETGYKVNKIYGKVGKTEEYAIANEDSSKVIKIINEYYLVNIADKKKWDKN